MAVVDSEPLTDSDVADRRSVVQGVAFETSWRGRLRTAGIGFLLPREMKVTEWKGNDAVTLAKAFDPLLFSSAPTARGKVFFVAPFSEEAPACICYQVHGADAALVACGNAAAAAAVVVASQRDRTAGLATFTFIAEKFNFDVSCTVTELPDGRSRVDQSWTTTSTPEVTEIATYGSPAIQAKIFNDYIILDEPCDVRPESVVDLLAAAGRIQDKIAIVDGRNPGPPSVTFYNCNGRHGAAPLTGLATLALAAQRVSWLRDRLFTAGGVVACPSGDEQLPTVSALASGALALALPAMNVRIGTI